MKCGPLMGHRVSMNNAVPSEIMVILNKAVGEDINNFTISSHGANKKGEGYMGHIFFVSLTNKANNEKLHYVVKRSFSDIALRKCLPIKDVFFNEIYFYTKLWPKFKEFQKRIPSIYHFDNIAKCVATTADEGVEALVLENLKFQGFVIYDKKKIIDKSMFEFIFKLYGRFHATSFAYKDMNPQEFSQLVDGTFDNWRTFVNSKLLDYTINFAHKTALDALLPGTDDAIIEKYKHYVDDGVDIFLESLSDCKYSVIIHGDNWSNNMMFKFNDSGQLIDLKLLDFQFIRLGSAVCDLSYCLYAGGTKETFDDLETLLQIYHTSLSENLKAYGCDPDKLYPFEALKNDWKKFCQFGVYTSLSLWRLKLVYDEEIKDLTDITEITEESRDQFFSAKYDKETFSIRARDIIVHLYENNYLC